VDAASQGHSQVTFNTISGPGTGCVAGTEVSLEGHCVGFKRPASSALLGENPTLRPPSRFESPCAQPQPQTQPDPLSLQSHSHQASYSQRGYPPSSAGSASSHSVTPVAFSPAKFLPPLNTTSSRDAASCYHAPRTSAPSVAINTNTTATTTATAGVDADSFVTYTYDMDSQFSQQLGQPQQQILQVTSTAPVHTDRAIEPQSATIGVPNAKQLIALLDDDDDDDI